MEGGMPKPRNRSVEAPLIGVHIAGTGITRSRGFNCHACGSWFGVFHNAVDLNAGQNAINGDQTFALECPTCTHSDEYSTREIVEMKQPTAPQQHDHEA